MLYRYDGVAPILVQEGGCFVAPTAAVIGKVRLGGSASVWFGAVLRGDNEWISVGERSNVQDNAALHTDPGCPLDIGAGCTIGHGAILHGCRIAAGTLIGMGAIVLNRATIGESCLVGAGALVTEGKSFPPGSLILGNPARLVRPLDEEEKAALARSADSYVRRAARFAATLAPAG